MWVWAQLKCLKIAASVDPGSAVDSHWKVFVARRNMHIGSCKLQYGSPKGNQDMQIWAHFVCSAAAWFGAGRTVLLCRNINASTYSHYTIYNVTQCKLNAELSVAQQ